MSTQMPHYRAKGIVPFYLLPKGTPITVYLMGRTMPQNTVTTHDFLIDMTSGRASVELERDVVFYSFPTPLPKLGTEIVVLFCVERHYLKGVK